MIELILALFNIIRAIMRAESISSGDRGSRSAKKFAKDHDFEWLGKELVDCLYLRGSSLPSRDVEICYSMKGKVRGVEAVIFDLKYMLHDTQQVCHTVVAFRNEGSLKSTKTPSLGQKDLHVEIAGDWLICYYGVGIVATNELLAFSGRMYDVASQLVASQRIPSQPQQMPVGLGTGIMDTIGLRSL